MKSESKDASQAQQVETRAPQEAARADLIRWCESHGLPVPPPQSQVRADASQ